ncbi:hypothetical protein PG995_005366 [Apiospora arundinis]
MSSVACCQPFIYFVHAALYDPKVAPRLDTPLPNIASAISTQHWRHRQGSNRFTSLLPAYHSAPLTVVIDSTYFGAEYDRRDGHRATAQDIHPIRSFRQPARFPVQHLRRHETRMRYKPHLTAFIAPTHSRRLHVEITHADSSPIPSDTTSPSSPFSIQTDIQPISNRRFRNHTYNQRRHASTDGVKNR